MDVSEPLISPETSVLNCHSKLRKIPKSADIIGMRCEKNTRQIVHFGVKCSVENSSYNTVL